MADESVPETSKPITLLAPQWPIERVASSWRIPSWPERKTLTPRPTTRLQPHRLPNSVLLGHLQEESIHKMLGLTCGMCVALARPAPRIPNREQPN